MGQKVVVERNCFKNWIASANGKNTRKAWKNFINRLISSRMYIAVAVMWLYKVNSNARLPRISFYHLFPSMYWFNNVFGFLLVAKLYLLTSHILSKTATKWRRALWGCCWMFILYLISSMTQRQPPSTAGIMGKFTTSQDAVCQFFSHTYSANAFTKATSNPTKPAYLNFWRKFCL